MTALNPVLNIDIARLFRFPVLMASLFLFQFATVVFALDQSPISSHYFDSQLFEVKNGPSAGNLMSIYKPEEIFLWIASDYRVAAEEINSISEPRSPKGRSYINFEHDDLQIAAVPRFYEKAWFILLIILSIGLLIYSNVHRRVRHLEKSELKLKNLLHIKTEQLWGEKRKSQAQADEIKQLYKAKGDFSHGFTKPFILQTIQPECMLPEPPIKHSVIGIGKPKHNRRPSCNTDPFLQKVTDSLEKHYSTPEFNVLSLALDLNLSRSYMARKIKKMTGLTSGEYIKKFRMEKAYLLLTIGMTLSITEVAFAVGFKSHSYFSHTFKEHFGKTPSEYLEEKAGIDSES